jgi:thioredoxin 1
MPSRLRNNRKCRMTGLPDIPPPTYTPDAQASPTMAAMSYTAHFTPETQTRADIDATAGPLVLEFGTDWCGHCMRAQPSVQADSAVPHVKVEDGPGRPLGRSYRVKLWPTLVFLKDGQEVARVVRPTDTADLEAALARIV